MYMLNALIQEFPPSIYSSDARNSWLVLIILSEEKGSVIVSTVLILAGQCYSFSWQYLRRSFEFDLHFNIVQLEHNKSISASGWHFTVQGGLDHLHQRFYLNLKSPPEGIIEMFHHRHIHEKGSYDRLGCLCGVKPMTPAPSSFSRNGWLFWTNQNELTASRKRMTWPLITLLSCSCILAEPKFVVASHNTWKQTRRKASAMHQNSTASIHSSCRALPRPHGGGHKDDRASFKRCKGGCCASLAGRLPLPVWIIGAAARSRWAAASPPRPLQTRRLGWTMTLSSWCWPWGPSSFASRNVWFKSLTTAVVAV